MKGWTQMNADARRWTQMKRALNDLFQRSFRSLPYRRPSAPIGVHLRPALLMPNVIVAQMARLTVVVQRLPNMPMISTCRIGTALVLLTPCITPLHAQRLEVVVSPNVRAEPVTGRVYVAISRSLGRQTPIEQTGETGVPLFAVSVSALAPGASAAIDATAFGHPIQSLRDLPRGEYWAQPFVNVYTRFARGDGHTVWLHMDQWEGQNWKRSPGNLYGDPVQIKWDPASRTVIRLIAD